MSDTDYQYETLLVETKAPGVVVVTMNRPDRFNAMTNTMFDELEELAWRLDALEGLRVVILTGAGRAFCSGYDLADADALPHLGALGMLTQQERAARTLLAIRQIRVPVIAAVNGAAAGGGFSLSLICDIRLASTAAKFNAAFVRIGLTAGDLGASWNLTRLIGPARTSEICFTGRMVGAEEAVEMGLANSLHEPDQLLDDALALADQIVANSPGGVQMSKRALHANLETGSYAAAIELENRGQALMTRTEDMAEALAALKERRPAVFQGR